MKKEMKRIQQIAAFVVLAFIPGHGTAAPQISLDPVKDVEMATFTPAAQPLQFSARVGLGFFRGELNEYVYVPEIPKKYRLSGLVWDVDSLLMGRVGGSMQYKEWLTLTVDSWLKLSDGSGYLNDYDWLIVGEDWTHWSKSDADVTSASIFDVSANIEFFRKYNYILRGIVGFKRDHFEIVANGGKFIYSTYNFRDTTGKLPGVPGVTYEQTMTAPYIGLGFSAAFTNNIALSGRAIYSPFAEGEATDHHHLRNLVVKDEVSGGDMFAFDLSVDWAFQHNLVWNVSTGFQQYNNATGDSVYSFNDTGEVVTHEDGTGMSQEMFQVSSNLIFTF